MSFRVVPVGAFPSIKSILSVTGTIDIDKFNRGFEEDSEADKDTSEDKSESVATVEAEVGIKPCKRPRIESSPSSDIEQKSKEQTRKPVSLWFKKQLVLHTIKETKMDLSAYGIKGKQRVSCLSFDR